MNQKAHIAITPAIYGQKEKPGTWLFEGNDGKQYTHVSKTDFSRFINPLDEIIGDEK